MSHVISSVPTSFDLKGHCGRWFRWREVSDCFWPAKGAASVNPDLAPVRSLGGVYLIAWSANEPVVLSPVAPSVRYIGECSDFKRRMGQFGTSAGLWGDRAKGHSAGYRWPKGQTEHTWVAFFPIGNDVLPHLGTGLRRWMEAVALEEYRLANGRLPEVNDSAEELAAFS